MSALTKQQIIQVHYSGQRNQDTESFNLIFESAGVLIAGIVIWRLSTVFLRKKRLRSANRKFETAYSKEWKNRNKQK
ncbi:MAG: hypothetical protein EP338_05540 [Bacteroidetes bacterium]|nr:MAG: hypothetical protein EP338_05540 [Bacteroidota bacterium]